MGTTRTLINSDIMQSARAPFGVPSAFSKRENSLFSLGGGQPFERATHKHLRLIGLNWETASGLGTCGIRTICVDFNGLGMAWPVKKSAVNP
ncbi:unnamed protein product [Prunus armeniaca]|uniref:Uncharacterized protein n=1 Tax=Prunus armeniaca TaxID=36596 RepID=A0A6J5WP57_PRUAR|nr:unnamed protein product [Prunus armeniaca]